MIATYKYSGANPGADATERVIFSTVGLTDNGVTFSDMGRHRLSMAGIHRIIVVMDWDTTESQTLKAYYTENGEASSPTWVQFAESSITVTAPDDQIYDLLVEGKRDLKISLTNGGAAKTKHVVRVALIEGQRGVAA